MQGTRRGRELNAWRGLSENTDTEDTAMDAKSIALTFGQRATIRSALRRTIEAEKTLAEKQAEAGKAQLLEGTHERIERYRDVLNVLSQPDES